VIRFPVAASISTLLLAALALTGCQKRQASGAWEIIPGQRIGLVNRVVPAGQEVEAALGMAGLWARRAPLSLWFAKHAVNVGLTMPLEAALAFEIGLTAQLFTTDDRAEGLRAFQERREAEFRGR